MRRRRLAAAAIRGVSVLVFAAACSSGSPGTPTTGVSIGELTGTGCPVPLAAAAGAPNATASGTSTPLRPSSTLATKVDGVSTTCTLTTSVNGAPTDLTLTLVATRTAHAAPDVLLPVVQRSDFASVAELRIILPAAQSTAPGNLVSLPGTAPTAFAIVNIGGAASSAFVLAGSAHTADGAEPTRAAIDTIAADLATRLG